MRVLCTKFMDSSEKSSEHIPAELSKRTVLSRCMDLVVNPRRTALGIALFADVLQIVLFPLFGEGALSPGDDLLAIAVAWVLTRLLGWHWAFLPTFMAELVPVLDLVP